MPVTPARLPAFACFLFALGLVSCGSDGGGSSPTNENGQGGTGNAEGADSARHARDRRGGPYASACEALKERTPLSENRISEFRAITYPDLGGTAEKPVSGFCIENDSGFVGARDFVFAAPAIDTDACIRISIKGTGRGFTKGKGTEACFGTRTPEGGISYTLRAEMRWESTEADGRTTSIEVRDAMAPVLVRAGATKQALKMRLVYGVDEAACNSLEAILEFAPRPVAECRQGE